MKIDEVDDDEQAALSDLRNFAENDDEEELRCLECNIAYISKRYLYNHLLHHVRQPYVELKRVSTPKPPLKITLKTRSGNSFEIISSPVASPDCGSNSLDEKYTGDSQGEDFEEGSEEYQDQELEETTDKDQAEHTLLLNYDEQKQPAFDPFEGLEENENQGSSDSPTQDSEDSANVRFSPNLAEVIGGAFLTDIDSPFGDDSNNSEVEQKASTSKSGDKESENVNTEGGDTLTSGSHASPSYGSIPGAEPTPPPELSPTGVMEYPKIKIKTTGLFKDPERQGCIITEITDDNPTEDSNSRNNSSAPIWTTPSLEDPLKLPESDDNNLLSLFNNNDRAKDFGFSTSTDNEFISLDTFNERNNRGAMQLYNPNNAQVQSSSLETLTGLPMQALAQQVSRLQPNGGQGLHQQNVLINIQQFPSQPQPQAPYPQHQPMYSHYPPHPGQPQMHQPYGYQPPNPMYYPPAPGYPPQHPGPHMPPPQHQMGQMQPPPPMSGPMQPQMGAPGQPPNSMAPSSQSQPMPPPNLQQPPNSMQGGYRPPMPPNKPPVPRGPQQAGPRMPGGPRGPPMNQRAPMARPRGPVPRPRGTGHPPVRGQVRPRMGGPPNGIRPPNLVKRGPDQNSHLQIKRKKLDVLTPDKDDDDCQVICMQPKNTDGGLPQIESVQGGTSAENSIMHLSDSITLSVRNPPPKPVVSPQKSDAKAVANILATRGITVTAAAKPKEKETLKQPSVPTALSLNGAVSIVASQKTGVTSPVKSAENLPTVDLTDDTPSSKQELNKNRSGLPYRCDLCPAQYPNAIGLNKHRQQYHKTNSGMCELGIPLINLKQPGMMLKLSQMGINNYIPLPGSGPEYTFALPIISTKNPGNIAALGSTQMLSLGPVRAIPKPGVNPQVKK